LHPKKLSAEIEDANSTSNHKMKKTLRSCGAALFFCAALMAAQPRHRMRHASVSEDYHFTPPTPGYDPVANPLPGMPPVLDPKDIYSAGRPGALSAAVRGFRPLIYVPNGVSNTVDVIDPQTLKVVDHFAVGKQPQHVVPSWDLKTLWVLNDQGNSLTRLDPTTGKELNTIPVDDPYNMYYTPDGKFAIVVAEARRRLDFHDPNTMAPLGSIKVLCKGVDHIDFSANGRFLIASCEFSGQMIKVDVASRKLVDTLTLGPGRAPQDVKLSPDGRIFFVADMNAGGVHLIDAAKFKKIGFIPTGRGAHGLYTSRDSRYMYVSNRGEGSVSLIEFATMKVATTWKFPGGGSPDMGGVSTDGKVLWLSGRYNSEVYAIDTADGHLIARIPVGRGPHGLCVYPQPGRYSLGHTGILR
jgi:YVTN family beta-propeller protein